MEIPEVQNNIGNTVRLWLECDEWLAKSCDDVFNQFLVGQGHAESCHRVSEPLHHMNIFGRTHVIVLR
jgi:hypothetical protein